MCHSIRLRVYRALGIENVRDIVMKVGCVKEIKIMLNEATGKKVDDINARLLILGAQAWAESTKLCEELKARSDIITTPSTRPARRLLLLPIYSFNLSGPHRRCSLSSRIYDGTILYV